MTAKILFIITIIPLVTAYAWSFEKETITNGMVFYEINEAAISKTRWKLTYYYNLTEYFDNIDRLMLAVESVNELCEKNTKIIECIALQTLLKEHLRNTQLNSQKIESFKRKGRSKRWAPFGFFGDALGWLFGLATDSDAEMINNKINHMEAISVNEKMSIENQLYIIEKTVKLSNESYTILKNKIEEFAKLVNEEITKTNIQIKINSLTTMANLIIALNTETYNDILNILEDSLNGKIVNLIPQGTLTENLRKIASNLKVNQKLPINLDYQSPYNIFSVTNLQGVLTENRIIITLYIPIIDVDDLRLYKTIPIPMAINDSVYRIIPNSEYFLFDSNSRELTPMTTTDLNNCKKSFSNVLICNPEQPTFIAPEASCELTILLDPKPISINSICNILSLPKKNYIIPLYQNNSYYCLINEPIQIKTTCPGKSIRHKELGETGIVTINPGCSIITNEMRFTAENNIFDSDNQLLKPLFNISAISSELTFDITKTWKETTLKNFTLIPIEDKNKEFGSLLNIIEDEKQKSKNREEILRILSEFQNSQDPLYIKVAYFGLGLLAITIFCVRCILPALLFFKK